MTVNSVHQSVQEGLLGPLLDLVNDPQVSEILINGPDHVLIERRGILEPTGRTFPGGLWQLNALINCVAEAVGRTVSPEQPILDARLEDRSRVHVIIPPCASEPHVNIRPYRRASAGLHDLLRLGAITDAAAEFLEIAVLAGRNIVVSGPTGAGKSTVLNALAGCIPKAQRVILIEDTSELFLENHPHVVALEAQPAGAGASPISIRDLFQASLRMRPDRIIVGEVRRSEALDVAQAMLSGHAGVMTTIHAESPRAAIVRLESLSLTADPPIPESAVRRQLAAVHMIVQVTRDHDGRRRVAEIAEIAPARTRGFRVKPLFLTQYDDTGPRLEMSENSCSFSGKLPILGPGTQPVKCARLFGLA